jgi:hypothetical protein
MGPGLRRDDETDLRLPITSRAERISIEVFSQRGADRLRQHCHMPVIRVIETGDPLRAGGLEAGDLVLAEGKSEELDG